MAINYTTTFTRLYAIDDATSVIDSPGFQEFGLVVGGDDDRDQHRGAQACSAVRTTRAAAAGVGLASARAAAFLSAARVASRSSAMIPRSTSTAAGFMR